MARPKPTIILEQINPKTYKADQVLKADQVYAVFYEGKPVNIRTLNTLVSYPGPKYKQTLFCNKGYAFNLAKKLNKQFKTDQFVVHIMTGGTPIYMDDDGEWL